MPPLSSLLLQRGVATLEQVEAALARQAVRGGDLITNLLEAADVDEAQLVEIMADCDGLRPASPGALPVPGPDTQRVLPSSLAMRHQIFPLRLLKHTLLVAVSEPLPSTVERDVSFTLGLRLEQRITTLVRIQQALALSYGAPLNRRSRRILARLDGLADPCPSEAPSPLQVGDSSLPPRLPHGPVAPPERPLALQPMAASRAPARRATLPIVPAAAPKTPALLPQPNADESNPASSPRPLHGVRHVRSRKPRRGPFTLVMARNALDQAESTSTALRVLFDFTRQFFEYTAMFLVREDLAEGNDAAGPGATGNRIRGIGVPLEIPSILSRARERRAPLLEVPSDDGIDAVLREDLQRPMHAMVLVLPLAIRNRVVALLFGDDGKVDVDLAQVGDVLALAPVVGSTIERLVLQRKVERARLSSSPSHQRSQPASPQEPPPKRRTTSTDLPQLQAPAAAQPAPAHRAAPVVAHHPSSTSTTAQRAVTSAHDPESPVLPQNAPQAQRQISPAAASVRSDLHTTADQRPGPHASDAGVLSPAAASVRGSVWDPTPPPVPDLPRVAPASSDPGMFVSRVVSGSSPLPQPSAHQAHADRWSAVLPASASDDSLNRPRAADPSPRTMLSAREPAQPDENIDKMEEPSSECSAPDQAGLAAPEPTAQRADRRTAQSSPDGETSGPPSESEQRAHEQQPGPSSDPGQGLEAEQPRRANVATATEPSGDAGAAPGSRGPTSAAPEQQYGPVYARGSDDDPELIVGEADDDDEMSAAVLEELQKSPQPAPMQARSEPTPPGAIVQAPRIPPKSSRPADVGLPLVIVDVRGEAEQLLDRIEEGSLADGEAMQLQDGIAALGPTALEVLAERFPGVPTVTADPEQDRFLPASKCGPLLRLAVEFGHEWGAAIEDLLRHPNPQHRLWATAVAAEAGVPQAAPAVSLALFDDDDRVRAMARGCLCEAAGKRMWASSVRELVRRVAGEASKPPQRRVMAIEALGALRDGSLVPLLIDVIDAEQPEVRAAALAALWKVTLCELPGERSHWSAWWNQNAARGRFEWLLDALVSADNRRRDRAHAELVEIVGEDFGYRKDAAEHERAQVAEAFRAWWERAEAAGSERAMKDSARPRRDGTSPNHS